MSASGYPTRKVDLDPGQNQPLDLLETSGPGAYVSGNVFLAVGNFSATSATNQIEFPYLGDACDEMRMTYPATLTVEVLQ